MKKVIVATTIILVTGLSAAAFAEQGHGGKRLDRLKSKLGLNDTQVTQVESIMQEQRSKMEALRSETEQRMQSVLTAEQFEQFKEMKSKRRGRKGMGRHGKRGGKQCNNQQQQSS